MAAGAGPRRSILGAVVPMRQLQWMSFSRQWLVRHYGVRRLEVRDQPAPSLALFADVLGEFNGTRAERLRHLGSGPLTYGLLPTHRMRVLLDRVRKPPCAPAVGASSGYGFTKISGARTVRTLPNGYCLALGDAMEWGTLGVFAGVPFIDLGVDWREVLESAKRGWSEISDRVKAARDVVEPVAWVVGSILALVPGTFAIHKWIYYRRSRLPDRLDELLQEEEPELRTARNTLAETILRPHSTETLTQPIFVAASLGKAMRRFGWVRWWKGNALPAADENLDNALSEIDQQMKYLGEATCALQASRSGCVLAQGRNSCCQWRKGKSREEKKDHNVCDRTALSYFLRALEIDETDIEALEYAGHQHRILNELDEALVLLTADRPHNQAGA